MKKTPSGPIMMTPDALNYMEEWIAFSPDYQEVLGHGKTAHEASEMAKRSELGFGFLFFMSKDLGQIHI